jgi:hypothetical protein
VLDSYISATTLNADDIALPLRSPHTRRCTESTQTSSIVLVVCTSSPDSRRHEFAGSFEQALWSMQLPCVLEIDCALHTPLMDTNPPVTLTLHRVRVLQCRDHTHIKSARMMRSCRPNHCFSLSCLSFSTPLFVCLLAHDVVVEHLLLRTAQLESLVYYNCPLVL